MKGRSQRLQAADPPDDWVDDSWIVDCICGVNFDDGEEMVKCDECGVWVHTRCSRYVKEEELFSCDKCKNKENRNDIEETEVAQVLVELPTKTMRIDSNNVVNEPAKKPPLGIWTEMPMEEKVHIQGIPGGDPGLFSGLSSVFSQQLWKCTGYVPKKFNFQYKEFPCWDADKEDAANVEEDYENAFNKGSRVLSSLPKERILGHPVTACIRTRTKGDNVNNDGKVHPKEVKKSELGDVNVRCSLNGARKEKSLHRSVVAYSGRRKKEESGTSKDTSGKKKARIIDKNLDVNERARHAPKTVFTPTSDAKKLEFYEDRSAKSYKTDIRSVKNRNLRDSEAVDPTSDCHIPDSKTDEIPKHDVAAAECAQEGSSAEFTCTSQDILVKDRIPHNVCVVNTSAKEVALEDRYNGIPEMEVGESCAAGNSNGGYSDKLLDLPEKGRADSSPEIKDDQASLGVKSDKSLGSQKFSLKTEVDDISGGLLKSLSASHPDANYPKKSPDSTKSTGEVMESTSGNCNGYDFMASSLRCNDKKPIDVSQNEGELSDCGGQKDVDFSVDSHDHKEEANGSEGSTMLQKSLSEPKQISEDEELSKSGVTVSAAAPSGRPNVAASLGKSSCTGTSIVVSKSSSSNKSKPSDGRNVLPVGYQVAAGFREHASSDMKTDEGKHGAMWKTGENSLLHSSRTFHTKVPKGNASDSKSSAISSSSKSSIPQNVSAKMDSADSTCTQSQSALPAQKRLAASGSSSRVGKSNHRAFHPSCRGGHAAAVHQSVVPNSPAGLSDEELALLLHKELNSSPRVSRVRQASLPQLAPQALSNLHVKRTSSSVAKDHNSVSKRKGKDSPKDSSTHPHEVENGASKTSRAASSSDEKRQDRFCNADASSKEAKGPPARSGSFEKNASLSKNCTNCGPSSSNMAYNSRRLSRPAPPLSNSEDDFTTDQPPVYCSLPGLINEILSKGRRMTYEKLCDSVLPHWPSLWKHNGELYAYSSHSLAVLDCLRNRHEWAYLVDCGPKRLNSCRKRRSDCQDSESNEDSKQQTLRVVESRSLESQGDNYPKGNVRTRIHRRLTLQGRAIKDLRSKSKSGTPTVDDDGGSLDSSDDSIFSEED